MKKTTAYDRAYPQDYSMEEVQELFKEDTKEFLKWMQGQTMGLADDNTVRFFRYDVERFKKNRGVD
jgi:inorganic pyrophosphatase/exopolyphosphatase